MNRIWKYVKTVEKKLPPRRRIEIAGEIYATLKARREALEKEQGRKADDAQIDALLREFGEPEQVASRYAVSVAQGPHELVERYMAAVERHLPMGVQTYDILAELREVLSAKIEAREDAQGRPASRDDIVDILKAFGSPEVTAHRYKPRPALIGPELTPYFWQAQRLIVGLVLALTLVLGVVDGLGTNRPVSSVFGAIGDMWDAGIFTFGAVTIAFILADYWAPRWNPAALWDPRTLPESAIRPPRTRFESLLALVFDAVFILWWIDIVKFPNELPPHDVRLSFSEAWAPLDMPILILALLTAAVHLADVIYPGWSRLRSAVTIAGCAAGIVVISILLGSGTLVDVVPVTADAERVAFVEYWITRLMQAALGFTAVIWAIELAVEVWRMMRSFRLRSPMQPA